MQFKTKKLYEYVGLTQSTQNIIYLQRIDLILQSIDILNRDVLTCNLALNLLQPFVQLVQIFVGLPELLLDGLLHRENN